MPKPRLSYRTVWNLGSCLQLPFPVGPLPLTSVFRSGSESYFLSLQKQTVRIFSCSFLFHLLYLLLLLTPGVRDGRRRGLSAHRGAAACTACVQLDFWCTHDPFLTLPLAAVWLLFLDTASGCVTQTSSGFRTNIAREKRGEEVGMGKNNLRIEFNFGMKIEKHPGFRLLRKECFPTWQCVFRWCDRWHYLSHRRRGCTDAPREDTAESVPWFPRLDLCLHLSVCFQLYGWTPGFALLLSCSYLFL